MHSLFRSQSQINKIVYNENSNITWYLFYFDQSGSQKDSSSGVTAYYV